MMRYQECPTCQARYIEPMLVGEYSLPVPTQCVDCGTNSDFFDIKTGPCSVEAEGVWPLRAKQNAVFAAWREEN